MNFCFLSPNSIMSLISVFSSSFSEVVIFLLLTSSNICSTASELNFVLPSIVSNTLETSIPLDNKEEFNCGILDS